MVIGEFSRFTSMSDVMESHHFPTTGRPDSAATFLRSDCIITAKNATLSKLSKITSVQLKPL